LRLRFSGQTEGDSPATSTLYDAGWGHGPHFEIPDLIEKRPKLYIQYAEALYDIVSEKGPPTPSLDKEKFMDVIRKVAALPGQQQQIELLSKEVGSLIPQPPSFAPEQDGAGVFQNVLEGLAGIDFEAGRYWAEFKNSTDWPPYVPTGSVTKGSIMDYALQWTRQNWEYAGPP